jgi:tRNA A-37 threonylcarbamoyl transferase component Bud32
LLDALRIYMSDFIRINHPPYRWLVHKSFLEPFKQSFIGHEQTIYNAAVCQPLKLNKVRSVFKMVLPNGLNLFCKHYKPYNFWYRIKNVFTDSKAIKELKTASFLRKQNILTINPIAVMEKTSYGCVTDAFLFTEDISSSLPLKQWLFENLSLSNKEDVLSKLARLIKHLHGIGFIHDDLHVGNILIDPEFNLLYLIDLHRGRLSYRDAAIEGNLAQMAYSLSLVGTRTDIMRFLTNYRKLNPKQTFSIKQMFKLIKRLRVKHWRSRTKRCLNESSSFAINRVDDLKIWHRRDISMDKVRELISKHRKLVSDNKSGLFKYSPRRAISIQDGYFIKEYIYSFIDVLKNIVRTHPAKRAWLAGQGLIVRDVPTAYTWALIEEYKILGIKRSYLVLEELNRAVPSNQYVTSLNNIEKPEFIKEFAVAIARLHNKGIYHADLKANNILIQFQGCAVDSPAWQFFFVDLDSVRFENKLSIACRIKNLAQLNASMPAVINRANRIRFFSDYCRQSLKRETKRNIISRIMQITIRRHHIWPGNQTGQ